MSVERAPTSPVAAPREVADDDGQLEAPAPSRGGFDPWLQRLRRPYAWASIVVVIALAVWWFGIRSSGSSPAAATGITFTKQLVTVTRGTMSTTVSAEGTVAAAQTDNLSFTSSGTVTAVNVQAGDTVQAGQVLATIDSAQLQASVTSAQSTVATAQAKLSDDEAAVASSAQIAADETSLASANDSLTSAQQALAGASLVATFNGVVSQVNITVGEQLGSGGTGGTGTTGSSSGSGRSSASLGSSSNSSGNGNSSSSAQIQVVSKGSYTVSLPISTNDIANVTDGQGVTLTVTTSSSNGLGGGGFRALAGLLGGAGNGGGAGTGTGGNNATTGSGATRSTGATATGTVTNVAKVATASSGVANYPVTVSFTANADQFYVGATVSGAIATNVRQNVLQVPARAVTTAADGTSTVTVAKNGKLSGPTETRVVKTGVTEGGMVEITSGLKEGDSVIESVPQFTGAGVTNGNGLTGRNGTGNLGRNFTGGGGRNVTGGAGQ